MLKLADEMIPRYWHHKVSLLARETDRIWQNFCAGNYPSSVVLMSICYITGLWLWDWNSHWPIGW